MNKLRTRVDYWHKLNPAETRWLKAFNREYEQGYRDGNIIVTLEDQRKNDRRRSAQRRDLLNICIELTENTARDNKEIRWILLKDYLEKTQDLSLLPHALY